MPEKNSLLFSLFIWRFAFCKLELFLRIEQDGNRSIIHERDFHHGLKLTGLAAQSSLAHLPDHILIEAPRLFRTRRLVKRRTPAPAHISMKGELRDHQDRAGNFGDAAVHLALLIFEDAQANDLVDQIVGVALLIGLGDTQQYQQSDTDFPNDSLIDRDICTLNTLHHSTHIEQLT